MNKLSKAQRDRLLAIGMGTVMLMAALWWLGITAKQQELAVTRQKSAEMQKKLHEADSLMRRERRNRRDAAKPQ